jgi:hypothetical protein
MGAAEDFCGSGEGECFGGRLETKEFGEGDGEHEERVDGDDKPMWPSNSGDGNESPNVASNTFCISSMEDAGE